jgi:TetR/AcrR family transcriptional regulator, fatty acid metabolism regulator protein
VILGSAVPKGGGDGILLAYICTFPDDGTVILPHMNPEVPSDESQDSSSANSGVKRLRGAERRREIAQTAVRLIGRLGLPGVSMVRIATELGVTDAALYKHYATKEEILIAAYDLLAERVFDWIGRGAGSPALDRLRVMGSVHAALFSEDLEGFNIPMSQFNVWIPQDGLRAHVDESHGDIIRAMVQLVEEGKADGSIREDAHSEVIVSELYSWIWWEDLSHLRSVDWDNIARRSAEMFDRILSEIRVAPA